MIIDDSGEITGDTTYIITYVGIDEESFSTNIYPNPVSSNLTIETNRIVENTIVNIYNQLGMLVSTMELDSYRSTIDMSYYKSGNYILIISSDNQKIIKKITKQ